MRTVVTAIACFLIALAVLPPLAAEDAVDSERLDIEQIRAARESLDTVLDDTLRERLAELFDAAIAELEQIESDRRKIERFEAQVAGTDARIDELRRELEAFDRIPRVADAAEVGVAEAQREVARERARLVADREALRNVEQRSVERAVRRNEVSKQLGELDQRVETILKEIRAVRDGDLGAELREATMTQLRALQESTGSEIEVLRAELTSLEARVKVLPWEIDLAQRRVSFREQVVAGLESRERRLREDESKAALERAIATCEAAAARSPVLGTVAEETRALAQLRWGDDNVVALSDRTSRELLATKKHRNDLERVVELTRRLYVAYGRRGSIGRWWPHLPDGFPTIEEIERRIREVQVEVPEVQLDLIGIEQARSKSRVLRDSTFEALRTEDRAADARPAEGVALDLFNLRRELLEELTVAAGRYNDQLVESEAALESLRDQMRRVEAFLLERVLWSRSVPRPIVPTLNSLGAAVAWLSAGEQVRTLTGAIVRGAGRPDVVPWLIAIVLLVALRGRIRRRLHEFGDRATDPERATLAVSLGATLYTALLTAPVPLAMLAGSNALRESTGSAIADAGSRALLFVAAVTALLEGIRQVAAPRGLAAAHFGWDPDKVGRVRRGLLLPEILCLPFLVVSLHLVFVGGRLTSPEQLQTHHNTLGRTLFIVAVLILGGGLAVLARLLWSRASDSASLTVRRADVGIQLAILLSTVLPAVLAALGFYVTALLLVYQVVRMAWLGFGVALAAGLIGRWMAIRRVRRRGDAEEERPDAETIAAETHARSVFRFLLAVLVAIGLYGIWSDALPLLGMLERVEIWPRVAVTDPIHDPLTAAGFDRPKERSSQGSDEAGAATEDIARPTGIPLPAAMSTDGGAGAADEVPLTLWRMLQAVLAAIVVTVLAKNLPGLIDLILRRRASIDRGARIALTTLLRYTILIVGASLVFGLLGVSWSNIQWLAAALTFGLGFGLQEIVANFVSGLILLLERPVRVGDAVNIGNLGGVVSQIHIRATTITLWDRSEMIVPNKEFITTKLINWTLSNANRRSEIAIRVAHGTDIERVKETLIEVARNHPNVHHDPAPHVFLMDFADDAIKLELRYFVDFGQGLGTKDGVLMAIERAFRDRGIAFAMPRLDIDLPRRARSTRSDDASGPTGGTPSKP